MGGAERHPSFLSSAKWQRHFALLQRFALKL